MTLAERTDGLIAPGAANNCVHSNCTTLVEPNMDIQLTSPSLSYDADLVELTDKEIDETKQHQRKLDFEYSKSMSENYDCFEGLRSISDSTESTPIIYARVKMSVNDELLDENNEDKDSVMEKAKSTRENNDFATIENRRHSVSSTPPAACCISPRDKQNGDVNNICDNNPTIPLLQFSECEYNLSVILGVDNSSIGGGSSPVADKQSDIFSPFKVDDRVVDCMVKSSDYENIPWIGKNVDGGTNANIEMGRSSWKEENTNESDGLGMMDKAITVKVSSRTTLKDEEYDMESKIRQRKRRNREHAKKSREKAKTLYLDILKENEELKKIRSAYEDDIEKFHSRIEVLKKWLKINKFKSGYENTPLHHNQMTKETEATCTPAPLPTLDNAKGGLGNASLTQEMALENSGKASASSNSPQDYNATPTTTRDANKSKICLVGKDYLRKYCAILKDEKSLDEMLVEMEEDYSMMLSPWEVNNPKIFSQTPKNLGCSSWLDIPYRNIVKCCTSKCWNNETEKEVKGVVSVLKYPPLLKDMFKRSIPTLA